MPVAKYLSAPSGPDHSGPRVGMYIHVGAKDYIFPFLPDMPRGDSLSLEWGWFVTVAVFLEDYLSQSHAITRCINSLSLLEVDSVGSRIFLGWRCAGGL